MNARSNNHALRRLSSGQDSAHIRRRSSAASGRRVRPIGDHQIQVPPSGRARACTQFEPGQSRRILGIDQAQIKPVMSVNRQPVGRLP